MPPPPQPILFKPRVKRSQLDASARIIQALARKRIRAKLYQAIDDGQLKIYEQRHASRAMMGAASLIAAHARGRAARQAHQDAIDEAEVDAYNKQKRQEARQKQATFKPCHPASYYRGAAVIMQRSARKRGWAKEDRVEMPRPIAPTFVPRIPPSKLRGAVVMIQALERGERVRRTQGKTLARVQGSTPNGGHVGVDASKRDGIDAPTVQRPFSGQRTRVAEPIAPSSSDGSASSGQPQVDDANERSRGASGGGLRGSCGGGGGSGASAESEAAALQQEAEDHFLMADTSGDGFVDEQELLVLFQKLMRRRMAIVEQKVLCEYLQSFRADPDTPLNLEFDAFVGVYNSFLTAQATGELERKSAT